MIRRFRKELHSYSLWLMSTVIRSIHVKKTFQYLATSNASAASGDTRLHRRRARAARTTAQKWRLIPGPHRLWESTFKNSNAMAYDSTGMSDSTFLKRMWGSFVRTAEALITHPVTFDCGN